MLADAPNQPAVPLHEGGKRGLLSLRGEALEQLRIGQTLDRFGIDQVADMPKQRSLSGHRFRSPCGRLHGYSARISKNRPISWRTEAHRTPGAVGNIISASYQSLLWRRS